MNSTLKKELPLIAILLIPFVYLAYIWPKLTDKVPVHWNTKGEIDRYGSSTELILMTCIPLFTYLILLIIPKIDPKGKLNKMGNKFHNLKLWLTIFMSMITLFILHSAKHHSLDIQNYMIVLVGFIILIFGNFFKTIQPNYFIGIRTPWTLENETVWKATHRLAGKMWFAGGLLIVLSGLIIGQQNIHYVLLTIIGIISIIPIVYSYFKFDQIKKAS